MTDKVARGVGRAQVHTGRGRDKRAGRPRGELREALALAAAWWQQQRRVQPLTGIDGDALAGATWPELRQRACLARGAGVQVLKNMVRAGELMRLGRVRVEGYPRPLGVYAPAAPCVASTSVAALDAALAAMVRAAAEEAAW